MQVAVLPYKLLHAYTLVDAGLVSQAALYCSHISGVLQKMANGSGAAKSAANAPSAANKIPPGLLVCRAFNADLFDRIQHHAAARKIGLGVPSMHLSAGALVSSVSKLLDRGIHVLMGGDGRSTQQHSRSSSIGGNDLSSQHSRRGSEVTSAMATMLHNATGTPMPSSMHTTAVGDVSNQSHEHPPHTSSPPVLQQKQDIFSGFMNRVNSFTSNLVAPLSTTNDGVQPQHHTSPPPARNSSTVAGGSDVENVFYYDHEKKRWRERGVESPPPPQPVGPPPTVFSHAADDVAVQAVSSIASTGRGVGSRYGAIGGSSTVSETGGLALLPPPMMAYTSPKMAMPEPPRAVGYDHGSMTDVQL